MRQTVDPKVIITVWSKISGWEQLRQSNQIHDNNNNVCFLVLLSWTLFYHISILLLYWVMFYSILFLIFLFLSINLFLENIDFIWDLKTGTLKLYSITISFFVCCHFIYVFCNMQTIVFDSNRILGKTFLNRKIDFSKNQKMKRGNGVNIYKHIVDIKTNLINKNVWHICYHENEKDWMIASQQLIAMKIKKVFVYWFLDFINISFSLRKKTTTTT